MRKHLWKVLTALAVVCMTIGVAAACGPDEPEPPVMYALTYVGGEGATGTAPEAESYAEGDTVTLKANPFAKEGYDFKAWSFGGTEYQPAATFTMPASNVTFTATWTEKPQIEPAEQFTLTYSLGDYTGGTAPTALTVETGTEVTLATPPAWAEHTFAGWKIGTETLQAGAKYTVTGNVTATAQWTLVTYAVTFDLDGGEMDPAPTQAATAKDGTFTLPATEPTKDGFHFAGWSDGTTTYEKGATYTMPGAAVKFTAQWTAVTHAELVGGYWVGSFTQGEGDEAVLTSVICVINPYETPTEVEMDEETVALKVGRSLFKAKMTVGDVTLYNTAMVQEFYWLEEEGLYTNGNVAFKVIDGALAFLTPEPMDEAPSDAKFTAMTRITAPAVPEFPASLYGRVEDDLHSPFTQIAITKDSETGTIGITLNGKEQKIEWFGDIAYLTESTAGATASVVGGTLYSETVEPEEEDGDPVTTFYLIPPEDEDVIVLAEGPAPTLYKVELYRNKADTSAYTTYYVEKNGKLENLDIAQDENYTFVGWADKTTDELVDLTDITKDLAVYEKWSVKSVHVEFDWGDGTFTGDAPAAEFELDDATLEGGDHWDIDLTEYNGVQLDDNTFNGWTVVVRSRDGRSSSNSVSKDTTSYTVYLGTQSVTFTAIFAQNDECVVTFDDQNGNQTAKTLKRGEQLGDALQDPDPCIGYVFKEWNTQSNGDGDTVTAETTVPDEPTVEYYAIWEREFTVTFKANGTTVGTVTLKEGEQLTQEQVQEIVATPAKAWYEFAGWQKDGEDISLPLDVNNDIELEAKFTLRASVTFADKEAEGTEKSAEELDVSLGEPTEEGVLSITLPEKPADFTAPENTYFRGWVYEEVTYFPGEKLDIQLDDSENEVKIVAVWESTVLTFDKSAIGIWGGSPAAIELVLQKGESIKVEATYTDIGEDGKHVTTYGGINVQIIKSSTQFYFLRTDVEGALITDNNWEETGAQWRNASGTLKAHKVNDEAETWGITAYQDNEGTEITADAWLQAKKAGRTVIEISYREAGTIEVTETYYTDKTGDVVYVVFGYTITSMDNAQYSVCLAAQQGTVIEEATVTAPVAQVASVEKPIELDGSTTYYSAAWMTKIVKGEKLELTGTATLSNNLVWNGFVGAVHSTSAPDHFRMDNYVLGANQAAPQNQNGFNYAYGQTNPVTGLTKEQAYDASVTVDWTDVAKIVVSLSIDNVTTTWTLTAVDTLADSYFFTLGVDRCTATFNSLTRSHASQS